MKIISLLIVGMFCTIISFAQLQTSPVCPAFVVDILGGNINKLYPKSTLGEIKKSFPCFTDIIEETPATACAGIFYKDKGLYFYTDRNYFEIRDNFKGKLIPALMGAARGSLFNTLGYPVLKDISWDAFQMEYGTLVLYYNKTGKINKIQISSRGTQTLKLCD